MAHFARLDANSIVTEVVVVDNSVVDNLPFPESEPLGVAYLRDLFGSDTNWAQTSYNNSFRYHYAGIDYTFDVTAQAFIPPKPYPSWLLNTDNFTWEAPVPYPTDGRDYNWDEATQSWVPVE